MKRINLLAQLVVYVSLLVSCSNTDNPVPTGPSNPLPNGSSPIFSTFSPETAFIGDEVTVAGENFGTDPGKLYITFDGVAATVVSVNNTSAKVIVPDDIEQPSAKVKLVMGDYAKTAATDFKLKAPVIESISPTSGLPDQVVTVKGKGFRKSARFDQLAFGGKLIKASSITAVSNTELTLAVPHDAAPGQYDISETVAGMTATAPGKFEVTGKPVFSTFSPESAFIGDEVTITGENLGTDPDRLTVRFGNVSATVVSVNGTTAKVIVPDDIEEAITKIAVALSDYTMESANDFKLKAPVIQSISHTSGFSGQRITVKGQGFRNSSHFDQVSFGNTVIPKGSVIPPGNTELTFSVPRKAAAGKYTISITVLGMTATASTEFEVLVPTITSFTPESGTRFTTVTITGTNFIDINSGSTTVFFSDKQTNGLQSTPALITSLTATQIQVKVPELVANRPQGWILTVSVVSATVAADKVFNYTE